MIAEAGIRLAWKNSWLRRMLFFAWLPSLLWALCFFLYEQALEQSPQTIDYVVQLLESFDTEHGEFNQLISELRTDPAAARHQVWTTLLMVFFRSPQAILMVLLIGLIAPPLISQDVRTRAFLVYFSRPLIPLEYILGKASIVWCYLLMITCLPALALYIMAILLSPDLSLIVGTWDLPFRILAASGVLLIPTTTVALCFSSMTSSSRYAVFGWFAVWILGWVSYAILTARDLSMRHAMESNASVMTDRWTLLSPYATLGEVQAWIFGMRESFNTIFPEASALAVVTIVAFIILLRQVSAPMRQ